MKTKALLFNSTSFSIAIIKIQIVYDTDSFNYKSKHNIFKFKLNITYS